ncbi:MAG TPA: PASTA domain-containing protein [Gemmatimonadales bacterium]
MRIRRRFSTGGGPSRLGAALRGLIGRIQLPRGRSFAWLAGATFAGTLIAGYLVAALWLFPAPIFASSRPIPSVIGLPAEAAHNQLSALQLVPVDRDRVTHPTIANGAVVWQDPPAGVVAPEGSHVRLTISAGAQLVPVPDVAGYDSADARLLIEASGLVIGGIVSAQAPTPASVVVNTRPPAGATLPPGASVTVVVSVGAATIRVPYLIGLTLDEVRAALDSAGLTLGTNYARSNATVEEGQVFFQRPEAGTLSAPGTSVSVILASGNDP